MIARQTYRLGSRLGRHTSTRQRIFRFTATTAALFLCAISSLANEARHLTLTEAVRLALQQNRTRSEEHTSELQSPDHLVCRLLLEKKKNELAHHNHDELSILRYQVTVRLKATPHDPPPDLSSSVFGTLGRAAAHRSH